MMKTFKIESYGEMPASVKNIVDSYANRTANKEAIFTLDKDITFCVCDLKEAHGNLNEGSKTAWLSPRNNDNSWNVNIKF